MTPSDRLKIEAALLIAVAELRRYNLAEFIADEDEMRGEFPDHEGLPVSIGERTVAMARCAIEMCEYGPHAIRKACASEQGAGIARKERAG